ncbi:hypothetical protein ACFO3D_05410 [Virgibacillus kekensis]|uniref:Uncharacterized protein n=1 Tax=Virgibacillus kekensis TaxID=202261 RepID=A0ABV9DFZ0_9BACI
MLKAALEKIGVIGKKEKITERDIYPHMYKALKWRTRINKSITEEYLNEHTVSKALFYHPIWLAKILLIARRPPFPPKKIPNMIFVDAVSGYRGLISSIPGTVIQEVDPQPLISPKINEQDAVKRYVEDVQINQINRSYVLKKPEYDLRDLSLVYLPLWRVKVESDLLTKEFTINANTGESEEYMSSLWDSNKLLLD